MQRITRRKFLNYSGAAALASASAFVAEDVSSATPTNILLIVSDDLGQQLGCYGDKLARTPNLNQLAKQGIRFVNSYVTQATCSSSRSSIYTGLYPHQTGFFPPDNSPVGQIGLAYKGSGYAMHSLVITMPQLLKAAGYRTGILGKLHVYPQASFPFDYERLNMDGRDIELIAQRAEEFLVQQPNQPFFLKVDYSDPHKPYKSQFKGYPQQPFGPTEVPPFPWLGSDTPSLRQEMAGYYNGVARMDAGVGMLLKKLARLGLANNTMVIFIGDHGPDFPRAKTTCYEAGLCIPFLVRWPGKITPNMVNKSLVSTVDILPTVLQAAGMTVPQNLAGRSLMQLFKGNMIGWRSVLCAEYTSHTPNDFNPRRCIRGKRYKYILNLLPNRWPNSGKKEELYDLYKDPNEFNNLAAKPEYQNTRNFLRGKLLKWRQQTADPLLNQKVLEAMSE